MYTKHYAPVVIERLWTYSIDNFALTCSILNHCRANICPAVSSFMVQDRKWLTVHITVQLTPYVTCMYNDIFPHSLLSSPLLWWIHSLIVGILTRTVCWHVYLCGRVNRCSSLQQLLHQILVSLFGSQVERIQTVLQWQQLADNQIQFFKKKRSKCLIFKLHPIILEMVPPKTVHFSRNATMVGWVSWRITLYSVTGLHARINMLNCLWVGDPAFPVLHHSAWFEPLCASESSQATG